MVCCARFILGRYSGAMREEQYKLFAWLMVAGSWRSLQSKHTGLSIHSTTRRFGVGECRLCALGSSSWMVQQYCMECWTIDCTSISIGHRAIRMEQTRELQEHRTNGSFELEFGTKYQSFRSKAVWVDQVSSCIWTFCCFSNKSVSSSEVSNGCKIHLFLYQNDFDANTEVCDGNIGVRQIEGSRSSFSWSWQKRSISLLWTVRGKFLFQYFLNIIPIRSFHLQNIQKFWYNNLLITFRVNLTP